MVVHLGWFDNGGGKGVDTIDHVFPRGLQLELPATKKNAAQHVFCSVPLVGLKNLWSFQSMAEEKKDPSVLILGGTGFIGRNLVQYLVENKLTNKIRVADKTLVIVAAMNAEHKAIFDQKEIVEYKQADLANDSHIKRIFDQPFDYVINLCGETRFGMQENDYKLKCVDPVTKCTAAALQMKCGKWIEMSTAQVYKPDKTASTETGKTKPWTKIAEARLQAEEIVKKSGINHVILRPSYVYGPGDVTSITPRYGECLFDKLYV